MTDIVETEGSGEMSEWQQTMMLQFVNRSGRLILQQLWQRFHTDSAGYVSHWDEEWRDVPVAQGDEE